MHADQSFYFDELEWGCQRPQFFIKGDYVYFFTKWTGKKYVSVNVEDEEDGTIIFLQKGEIKDLIELEKFSETSDLKVKCEIEILDDDKNIINVKNTTLKIPFSHIIYFDQINIHK